MYSGRCCADDLGPPTGHRDSPPVHAGGFFFGRRPTLPSETLRIPNRPRTAVTVRLSLSDDRDGFSGFRHFTQLLFLLGLPWAFGVFPGQDHFNRETQRGGIGGGAPQCGRPVLNALAFVVLGLVGLSEHAATVRGVQTFERQGPF